MSHRSLSSLSRLCLLSTAAALAGCGALQQVSVKDDNASSVAARAAIHPQSWARGGGSEPGIEVGLVRQRASSSRVLGAGEVLVLGGQSVLGPDTANQVATVQQGHVAYNHRFRFGASSGSGFELEPFVGVARYNLRFRLEPSASTVRPEVNEWHSAVIGGVTPRWRFNPWLTLEARIEGLGGSRIDSRQVEAALVISPAPQLALRLGYADRRHSMDLVEPGTSWTRVELRARGPFAALQLEF
jgi:hypothetical protein